MRQFNEERRGRALTLVKCLEDIAHERRELLLRLDNLNAQERAVILEQNTLHNLDALTSDVPDETLAMIFEAGLHCDGPRFGELVSHVSRRWRSIALDHPNLWTSIRCHRIKGVRPYWDEEIRFSWSECNGWEERAASYISRSKSSPINIHLRGLYTFDYTPAFFQLISDHIGRCSHLFFEHIPRDIFSKLLDILNSQPLPLLRSFALTLEQIGTFRADPLQLRDPLQLEAPFLTTAQLARIEPSYLHHFIPAFESVTSLRLTAISIGDHQAYNSLRDGLMNLKLLQHLELQLKGFKLLSSPDPLPILLPTVQLLHVASALIRPEFVNRFIASIRAQSLTTLSLNTWDEEEDEPIEPHFPLLRHLLLVNITEGIPDLISLAEKFPSIERLTCRLSTNNNDSPNQYYLTDLFTHIIEAGRDCRENQLSCLWPKLHTIATSACLVLDKTSTKHKKNKAIEKLRTIITTLQDNEQPIRKLLLPRSFFVNVGAEAAVSLKRVIEIGDYSDDWPMPFDRYHCSGMHSQ